MILKLLVMYTRMVWGIAPTVPDASDPMWQAVSYFGLVLDLAAVIAVAVLTFVWYTTRKD